MFRMVTMVTDRDNRVFLVSYIREENKNREGNSHDFDQEFFKITICLDSDAACEHCFDQK